MDENHAPGPIDADAHTDTNSVPPEQRTTVDARAAAVDDARKRADAPIPTFDEYDNPAGAIIVQELQDIRSEISGLGLVVLGMVWASGMVVGYVGFAYYRNVSAATETEANDG